MKNAAKPIRKSKNELLDKAADQLLYAVKQRIIKKRGQVDYASLKKSGYSKRFLARMKKA